MTRTSIREYTEAVRWRYLRCSKRDKGKILDEFTKVTGYHRKAVIRLLHQVDKPGGNKKRGRPRQYGIPIAEALRVAWEATERLCSKRLHPFLPELVRVLRRHGERTITAEVEAQLCRMSPSTIDRLLKPWHRVGGRRPSTTTKPGSLLKSSIPIRTFADWQENRPGFLEVDLVPHCGESGEGFYLNTLSAVGVASGWSECIGVWGKGQWRVGGAVHRIRQRLLKSGALSEAKQQELAAVYHGLNPVVLLKQINENLEALWKLAQYPAYQQTKVKTGKVSVT